MAGEADNITTIAVSVGTSDTPVVGANARRRLLILTNIGATTIFLRFRGPPNDAQAALNTGIALPPGAPIVIDSNGMFKGAITGISSAACNICGQEVYSQ